eukprot:730607-Prorocentrum_minimum.AAC.1
MAAICSEVVIGAKLLSKLLRKNNLHEGSARVGGWVDGWLEEFTFVYCSPRVTPSGEDPTRTLTGPCRDPLLLVIPNTYPAPAPMVAARLRCSGGSSPMSA